MIARHAVEVAPCLSAGGNTTGGDRPYGTDADTADSLVAYAPEIARCDATREGSSQDYETTTMVAHAIQAGALRTNPASGPDGVGVQADIAYTLEARAEVQAVCIHADAIGRTGDAKTPSADAAGVPRLRDPGMGIADDGTSYHLMANGQAHAVLAFDTTQITSALNRSVPKAGDPCHPLNANAHPPAITVALRGRDGGATAELGGEVATALRASQGGGDKPHVLTSAVRRLTPRECERLQGFPDDYTLIPWRNKPAEQCPDGPRYKALGNSWAVPKFVWLGKRIQALMPASAHQRKEAA